MKIAKDLMTSGVLGRGETRHCTQWEFPESAKESRFGRSPALRLAEARRQRGLKAAKRRGIFHFLRREAD